MASTTLRLALIVLRCAELHRSKEFYDALGVHLKDDTTPEGLKRYTGRVGDVTIELCPKGSANTSDLRLAFYTDQLANVLPALEDAGGEVVRTLGSPKLLYAVVKDPDGHSIELRAVVSGQALWT